MTLLKTSKDNIGALDGPTAAALVAASADVALVVDDRGMVRDVYVQDDTLESDLGARIGWIGRAWVDLLTPQSRARGQTLLNEALAGKPGKWRQLNHLGGNINGAVATHAAHVNGGSDLPVLYAGVTLRRGERVVLLGRDLRPMSTLQQRLVEAQQSMERDHAQLRHMERRYRMLLDGAGEPLLVLDAGTQKVTEANPAMLALLEHAGDDMIGQPLLDLFDPRERPQIIAALAATRIGDQSPPIDVRLESNDVTLHLTLLREGHQSSVLVRALPLARGAPGVPMLADQPAMLRLIERAPDGFVVTDGDGLVQAANPAFLSMAGLGAIRDAIGHTLDRWLGRENAELTLLLAALRERGTVRMFATGITGAAGSMGSVEVSAVSLAADAPGARYGFVLRHVDRPAADARSGDVKAGDVKAGDAKAGDAKPGRELPRSVDQLTELIGRVALKDLVREATDMIERLCIEAALEMTNDNRASAAELLGLSRQSLYVKLHRYGLGDLLEPG